MDFIFRNRHSILGRKTVATGDNKSSFRQVKEWWFRWPLHLQFLQPKSPVSAESHSRSLPKLRTKQQSMQWKTYWTAKIWADCSAPLRSSWRIFMLIIKYGTTKNELLYVAWFCFLFHKLLKYYPQFINDLDCEAGCFCSLWKMQVKECLQALIQKQRAMPVVSHIKAVYCPTKIVQIFQRGEKLIYENEKPHNRAVSVIYEHKKREIYVNFPWHDLCFVIECI